ncbi:hypothetical protein [Salinimicrobium flavum]|uniref:SGNH/GDSL hydrolase family protein n=1 Tax=Salinimicrobium flavum TaxID=1737065 RepID=A0ABW5IZ98_9FLAO
MDVLFIGSSHAYNSFDPGIFENYGLKSYNWGTNQQTHIQTEMVLREYLKIFSPKLVVYEVFPEMFALEGRESMTDFLNSGEPFQLGLKEIFEYDNSIIFFNTYLIKYSRELIGLRPKPKRKVEIKDYYKGYVSKEGENKYYKDSIDIKWIPRQQQIEAFERNIAFLKRNNINYVLVISPFPFQYNNSQDYINYLNSRGELLDYNKILEFDAEKEFSDYHHINIKGAKKINTHLAPVLRKKIDELPIDELAK